MEYCIAIDAGGTKTESVLIDRAGHILERMISLGCNPMDCGSEETRLYIRGLIEKMESKAPGNVKAVYGGIAGLNRINAGLQEYLRSVLDIEYVRMEVDGFSMISAALGHVDGCGMVCGTGSGLSIRIDGKMISTIGGYGYLIDTGGSGFSLAQAGLKEAFRYLDGRGPYTILVETMAEAVGKDLNDAIEEIYQGGRSFIASLAHVVFEGAKEQDSICCKILDQGAESLAELTRSAARYFNKEFSVVMNGGILKAYPSYADAVIRKASPQARMIYGEHPPIYGGCVEALYDCGETAFEEIEANFMEDYLSVLEK